MSLSSFIIFKFSVWSIYFEVVHKYNTFAILNQEFENMKCIEPTHLTDDEIQYELKIRSMPPIITRHRVDILRDRLISEMRKEVDSPTRGLITPLSEDLDICFAKLLSLEKRLYGCADNENEEDLLVLISRMSHLKFRLGRFKVGDDRDGLLIDGLLFKLSNYIPVIEAAVEKKVSLKNGLKNLLAITSGNRRDSSVSIHSVSNKSSPIKDKEKSLGAVPKIIPIINTHSPETPMKDAGEDLSDFYDSFDCIDLEGAVGGEKKVVKKPTASKISKVDNFVNKFELDGLRDRNVRDTNFILDSSERRRDITDSFSLGVKGFNPRKNLVNEPLRKPGMIEKNLSFDFGNIDLNRVESVNYLNRPYQKINLGKVTQPNNNNYMAGNTPGPFLNQPQNVQVPIQRHNYRNPIPNWHLCFTGDGKGLSVNDFLKQVNYMARADRVGNLELLESAIHLFSGSARNWYMAFERSFDSWETLTVALRRQFITKDGDFGIMKEIEQRLQLKDEPFIFYLASLLNMFDQLEIPLSEINKVDLVLRNISPHLAEKLAVFDIDNLQELSAVCKQIEDVQNKIKSRRPEPVTPNYYRNRISEVELSELDYKKTEKPISILKPKCVNCRETGHDFKQCVKEKMRIFCFRCGELGQTSYSCSCSNMGNPHREPKINEVYSSSQMN